MNTKKLLKIKFKSYLLLCVSIALPFGVIFGALTFILSLAGGKVYSNIIFVQLQGIPAGIANLFVGPFTLALMGLFFGIISYLPFTLFLNMIKGINIQGEWKENQYD